MKAYRAVVTGGGSGIGRALALELASRRAKVLVADIDETTAADTARAITAAGGRGISRRCDVTDLRQVAALATEMDDRFGGTDLIVNNAGVGVGGPVGDIAIDDWHHAIDVNLWGVIHGCHVFVPRLRAQGAGRILNVASVAGFLAPPELAPYNVAKAGVIALSETLAAELPPGDVKVTVLCPAFVKTNIFDRTRSTNPRHDRLGRAGMARFGATPRAVAQAALAAVDRGRLYALPQPEAHALWRAKRLLPALLAHGTARMRTIFERWADVADD